MSSVAIVMEANQSVKVIKVEEGEAGKARKLVNSILEELVDGVVGEVKGGGMIKGKAKCVKAVVKGEGRARGEIEFAGVKGASGYVPEVGKFVDRKFDCIG